MSLGVGEYWTLGLPKVGTLLWVGCKSKKVLEGKPPTHRLKPGFHSSGLVRLSQSPKSDFCVAGRLAEGNKILSGSR